MSRKKKEYRTGSKENYIRFLKENKVNQLDLSYEKYCKNIEICNWMFIEYALRTGKKITLPHGFGAIAVNKKKLNMYKEFVDADGNKQKYINLRPNWEKTRKLGKKIYHTNEHTDGYNFRWAWFPGEAKIYLSSLYVFKPGRYASREIARYIKNKPEFQYKELYMQWLK